MARPTATDLRTLSGKMRFLPSKRLLSAAVARGAVVILLALIACVSAARVGAQTGTATINGQITDPQGRIVPNVSVQAVNTATSVIYPGKTNQSGIYSITALPPGLYRMVVRSAGFKEINSINLVLHTQDTLEQNFALEIGSASESVTVNAEATNESPAVSMTVDLEFVENTPLNGRSFQDLIQLSPGAIAAYHSGNNTGYYSIDGQRQDANNFTVDGVSANLGGAINSASADGGLSGSTPSQTALGTTQSLVSIDALQEFQIQSSGYTAEYGRNPGGQVSFTTRSGTNDIHGTLFEYLRNTAFDAKSYAEDYYDEPKAPEHQNDFGGTVGGPVVIPKLYNGKDKTFFFISYEGLRLLTPAFESEYVPTQAFRNWAAPGVQPYLNSIPLPNTNSPGNQDGCTIPDPSTGSLTACDALFTHSYSNPSHIDNVSVRFDQNFGERLHVFLRYADTPSASVTGAESVYTSQINSHTWTAGLTANISSTLLNELRFNYSHDGEGGFQTQQAVGGSVPLARSLLVPPTYDSAYAYGEFSFSVPGSSLYGLSQFGGGGSVQHQYQLVDSLIWTRGNHSLKVGGDWRRLTPTTINNPYNSYVALDSLTELQDGYADSLEIGAIAPGKPVFDNLSLFAQDHWKISRRLSIDYGLRWEFDPPPGPSNGYYPVTLTSNDLATATLTNDHTQPYKTNYHSFAPRFGFAWNAVPSLQHALTVRGGFGIFYNTGQQTIGAAYSAYPFQVYGPTLTDVPFPLSAAALAPPSLNVPITAPYPYLAELTSPSLTLPYTEQWNLSIDEALNSRNTLTVSYVGNEGKKLLFTEFYQSGAGYPINPDFTYLYFTYNGSSSNYNGLQVQDRGRITDGLDLISSFTWAHALDNASSNYGNGLSPTYGNSDNDLREVFNLALNYQTPTAGSSRFVRAISHGWVIANRFSAQSGYPLNIYQDQFVPLPNGGFLNYSPDLVPGVPIYLHGSAANVNGQPIPGDWRLNGAAFALVPTDPTTGLPVRQGTLGRNYVHGPAFWTLNTSVQRSIPIHDELHLIFRVDAFNILNHPNLNYISTCLECSNFGYALGYAGTIGASNQLYAMGAARSLQFSLKLQF
jgi:hypothetical protein